MQGLTYFREYMKESPVLRIENISKSYGATSILRDVNLQVAPGELLFLLGPSGCGKTTLLRTIAGFEVADAGQICLNDRIINEVPAHLRGIGMVFQNYALWPHMSVFESVELGLKIKNVSSAERTRRVKRILDLSGIAAYADRFPHQLSGGQQQRVALARALVLEPKLVLLDEPLANLDQNIKRELRREIRRLQHELGLALIYVTHDREEALALSSQIAIMLNGAIIQAGPAPQLFDHPQSIEAAKILGDINLLEAAYLSSNQVDSALGVLTVATSANVSERVYIGFRPDDCQIGKAANNSFSAQVKSYEYAGSHQRISAEVNGTEIGLIFNRRDFSALNLGSANIDLNIAPERIMVFKR